MPKLPGINHRRAIRALQKAGYIIIRECKRHVILAKGERYLSVPRSNPIDAYTMVGIVLDAGLTVEEFLKLL